MGNLKRRITAVVVTGATLWAGIGLATPALATPAQFNAGIRVLEAEKHFTDGAVKIEGIAKIGSTLTAKVSNLSPSNTSGATYKYQWFRNGNKIDGANNKTYKIAESDTGKQLSVTVTATKDGYEKRVLTSKKTDKVPQARGTRNNPYSFGETANLNGVKVTPRVAYYGGNRGVKSWYLTFDAANTSNIGKDITGAIFDTNQVACQNGYAYISAGSSPQSYHHSLQVGAGVTYYGVDLRFFDCVRSAEFGPKLLVLNDEDGTASAFFRVP